MMRVNMVVAAHVADEMGRKCEKYNLRLRGFRCPPMISPLPAFVLPQALYCACSEANPFHPLTICCRSSSSLPADPAAPIQCADA